MYELQAKKAAFEFLKAHASRVDSMPEKWGFAHFQSNKIQVNWLAAAFQEFAKAQTMDQNQASLFHVAKSSAFMTLLEECIPAIRAAGNWTLAEKVEEEFKIITRAAQIAKIEPAPVKVEFIYECSMCGFTSTPLPEGEYECKFCPCAYPLAKVLDRVKARGC